MIKSKWNLFYEIVINTALHVIYKYLAVKEKVSEMKTNLKFGHFCPVIIHQISDHYSFTKFSHRKLPAMLIFLKHTLSQYAKYVTMLFFQFLTTFVAKMTYFIQDIQKQILTIVRFKIAYFCVDSLQAPCVEMVTSDYSRW